MKSVHRNVLLAAGLASCALACADPRGSGDTDSTGLGGSRPTTSTPSGTSSGGAGETAGAGGMVSTVGRAGGAAASSTMAAGSTGASGGSIANGDIGDSGIAGALGGSHSTDSGSVDDDKGRGAPPKDSQAPDAIADTTEKPDGDSSFSACIRALKSKCAYNEPENACSSLMTPPIPLTDGTTAGNIELMQGPYGSYVEWNEGAKFATPENALEATCAIAAASFGEPQSVTDDVLDLHGQDLTLYTVFRPACMKKGETYPVITWGNGTCGQAGGYGSLLATVASYGFVVVAANSRWTDQGNDEMLKALDYAKAAHEDSTSVLYQRLDLSKVGAMGHSQGGSATVHAATDARIKAVILWNGGTSASKPFLAVSGDHDVGGRTPADLATAVNGAAQPGAWLYYHKILSTGGSMTGHLTLMEQPERVTGPAVAWWKYMLNGDAEARKTFVGTDCGLCNQKDDHEFGAHDLP